MERLARPDPLARARAAILPRGALLVPRPPRLPAALGAPLPAAEVPAAARGRRARGARRGVRLERRPVGAARDRPRRRVPRARAAWRADRPRGAGAGTAVVAGARRARAALDVR